ncbi:MAG: DUF4125 family protein [Lachnospiraceae bacterium]|nr:DUF4125 family protein [Lachnospiraceae bacterium]
MEDILQQIDRLLEENQGAQAQALMEKSLERALEIGDRSGAVTLLNELIGFCRETGQAEKSYYYGEAVLNLLQEMGLSGTLPFATSVLNIASAYRAGGRLEDAMTCYRAVEQIYSQVLEPDDMLVASLYNNKALLYQEMGEFEAAGAYLERALEIALRHPERYYEQASSYANLAATYLQLGKKKQAEDCFQRAIALFEAHGVRDAHYCAALSSMAAYLFQQGEYQEAEMYFVRAMQGVEESLGRTEAYYRLRDNAEACRRAAEEQEGAQAGHSDVREQGGTGAAQQGGQPRAGQQVSGMELCRAYYETYGRAMIHEKFPEYEGRIAVGLAGEGSDCFGYDDETSRDHDWGPSFMMWVSDQVYEEIGEQLQAAYEELPQTFLGYTYQASRQGAGRRGVQTVRSFYGRLLGMEHLESIQRAMETENPGLIPYRQMEEIALAAAINGSVFRDDEGVFTQIRELLTEHYPERLRYLRIAEAAARFCQYGQYNSARMLRRGDGLSSRMMLGRAAEEALKLVYYMEGQFPPHDKWLAEGVRRLGGYEELLRLLQTALESRGEEACRIMEQVGGLLAHGLYRVGYISDIDSFLEEHVAELLYKSGIANQTVEELADAIARREFEAFDVVKNEGGRASCQDDWFTFSIMRKSQYLTWNHVMLLQYLYDFDRELERGHNLIEEKYGRMMESTAPGRYEEMKERFPEITPEKKEIIEKIVALQVAWMEEFAAEYPYLAGNARSIHTYEDNGWDTSYETYLRGEISTYSDKMLELYGRYIAEHAAAGKNLAGEIMAHSAHMYGYESLEDAEEGLRQEAERHTLG